MLTVQHEPNGRLYGPGGVLFRRMTWFEGRPIVVLNASDLPEGWSAEAELEGTADDLAEG